MIEQLLDQKVKMEYKINLDKFVMLTEKENVDRYIEIMFKYVV